MITEVLGTFKARTPTGLMEVRTVYLDRWQGESGKTLYTPRVAELLGGRDFAHRSAAIRYAQRVTGGFEPI